mmetsp:Transcript_19069/g.53809  ORF Transcript_19069/g.53809 Transcript_19069/m.53809 type:complete len:216 (-) Transcript_19069:408-1055(-)
MLGQRELQGWVEGLALALGVALGSADKLPSRELRHAAALQFAIEDVQLLLSILTGDAQEDAKVPLLHLRGEHVLQRHHGLQAIQLSAAEVDADDGMLAKLLYVVHAKAQAHSVQPVLCLHTWRRRLVRHLVELLVLVRVRPLHLVGLPGEPVLLPLAHRVPAHRPEGFPGPVLKLGQVQVQALLAVLLQQPPDGELRPHRVQQGPRQRSELDRLA